MMPRGVLLLGLLLLGAPARAADTLIDFQLDLYNDLAPLPTPYWGPGLSVQAIRRWDNGFYVGAREHAITRWATLVGDWTTVRFDTQGVAGYAFPGGRRWQLYTGVQLGVRAGFVGGERTYRQGQDHATASSWSARFSAQAALGYRYFFSERLGFNVQLNVPLHEVISDLVDGDTPLLGIGLVWRPGASSRTP
jgi:hypothetical protein